MSSFKWPPQGGGGVTTINGLSGAVTLAAGTGISITPSGNTLTIATSALTAAIVSINSDTTSAQTLSVGTAGTDFAITDPGSGSHVFNLPVASASNTGKLSSTDWSTFNSKQSALTIGNLTDAGTDGITVTGGTGAVIGSGTSIAQHVADTTHNGYLSSTDWNTFNGKQAAGNYITALTGDVVATGPGSVDAVLAQFPNKVYVDFLDGDDSTGTGSATRPWKTLQHAYNSITPTINRPYTIYLSGGNNSTDSSPITGKPNVAIVSDYQIQIPVTLNISGGTTNDGVTLLNIILNNFNWVRNDNSAIGMQVYNSQFFSGPTFQQNGGGGASFIAFNSETVNASFNLPTSGLFFNHTFLGSTTFADQTPAAFYEIIGGYNSSAMSISGGVEVYFAGCAVDVPFGASLTAVTTANGSPIFQTDSSSIPPTVTGAPTLNFTSQASYLSGNLRILNFNGGTGANSSTFWRGDGTWATPAVSPGAITLTNTHILVGNASNVAADVAMSGDATISNTGALTLATVNSNVGTFASVTVNAKGLVTAATALSGDATTSGAVLTLVTVNANVGSFGDASHVSAITVNAKGLVTAAASTSIQIAESQVTNLVSDLAAKQSTTLTNTHILVGNVSNVATDVAMSGDATLANTGAITLATVNANVGSFTNANITVNAKGLITAAANGSAAAATQPTVQIFTTGSGTYTTPANVTRIEVEMAGGGGGGGGHGGGGTGGTGGNTTFGSSLLTANGGVGGASGAGQDGGVGGSATVAGPAIKIRAFAGERGGGSANNTTTGPNGGDGGANMFGGAGLGAAGTGNGYDAVTNSGGGGGGAGGNTSVGGGAGGGAGGYIFAQINSPSATYSYAIGASGAGGTGTAAGGAGAAGIVIVREYYS